MKTGPGRPTGPTEGEGEVTTDREGSQQEPITKPENAGPSHTHEGAQQKQRKTRDTQTEARDREPKSPKGRSPKGNAKPQKGQRTFFPSSVADVALKARSLHEHKQERHLYKDISSPLRRQID